MPLAVKGIELIIYGSRKHYAHVSKVEEMHQAVPAPKVITWVTECQMKPYVSRRGVTFTAAAAVLTPLGILLEVLWNRILCRKIEVRLWQGLSFLQEDGDAKRFKMPSCIMSQTGTGI